ncbi:MAG: hypothetical protein KF764_06910 [Labilithrix sp.]|nr:hypothetical protein [Labilithrix sp.]
MAARRAIATASVALLSGAAPACYDFTWSEPAEVDARAEADPDAAAIDSESRCAEGTLACRADGVTLERCADGGFTFVVQCGGGCADAGSAPSSASCNAPVPCVTGGSYCGGDKLDGDPDVLYRCVASGAHTVIRRCGPGDCLVQPGRDDRCR